METWCKHNGLNGSNSPPNIVEQKWLPADLSLSLQVRVSWGWMQFGHMGVRIHFLVAQQIFGEFVRGFFPQIYFKIGVAEGLPIWWCLSEMNACCNCPSSEWALVNFQQRVCWEQRATRSKTLFSNPLHLAVLVHLVKRKVRSRSPHLSVYIRKPQCKCKLYDGTHSTLASFLGHRQGKPNQVGIYGSYAIHEHFPNVFGKNIWIMYCTLRQEKTLVKINHSVLSGFSSQQDQGEAVLAKPPLVGSRSEWL